MEENTETSNTLLVVGTITATVVATVVTLNVIGNIVQRKTLRKQEAAIREILDIPA